MLRPQRRFVAGALTGVLALALGPRAAVAQEPPPTQIPEGEAPIPKPRPLPPDQRTLRPTVAMSIAYGRMLGSVESGRSALDTAAWGPIPGVTVGLGVSRHVTVEGFAFFGSFNGGTEICTSCTARSQFFGLQGAYHLLDGVPFDPWFAAGAGWRVSHFAGNQIDGGVPIDFHGFDPLRLTIGADEYIGPIGIGGYTDLALGEYFQRTSGVHDTTALHTTISFGLRIVAKPFLRLRNRTPSSGLGRWGPESGRMGTPLGFCPRGGTACVRRSQPRAVG